MAPPGRTDATDDAGRSGSATPRSIGPSWATAPSARASRETSRLGRRAMTDVPAASAVP